MPEILTKPNKKKHAKKHGYRSRKSTHGGRKVLKRQQLKGRKTS
jgi:large subunit ribosomal protein L34